MSKTFKLDLNEQQAKDFVQLLNLAVKAERLNAAVNALVEAPSAVAVKAQEILALVKEDDNSPVPEDR